MMRQAHTVEQVRAAEAALLETLPDGALMQRAAHGLAHAVIDFLGGAYGRRVVLLVGPGHNGGDDTATGTTKGTGASNTATNDTATGTKTGHGGDDTATGTTKGTGASNTATNDTATGTRTRGH